MVEGGGVRGWGQDNTDARKNHSLDTLLFAVSSTICEVMANYKDCTTLADSKGFLVIPFTDFPSRHQNKHSLPPPSPNKVKK